MTKYTRKSLVAAAEQTADLLVQHSPAGIDINRGKKGKGVGVRVWPSGTITRNDTPLEACNAMTIAAAADLLGLP